MDSDKALREHVIYLLHGKGARITFEQAVEGFPSDQINTKPPNVPYTFWHLLEHLRIAQWDILEYSRNADYVSPQWPEGYWPSPDAQADDAAWQKTLREFQRDLKAMQDLVSDPNTDLMTPIPHGYSGHTILREALLLADHNAYHIGEFGILRQVMATWPDGDAG